MLFSLQYLSHALEMTINFYYQILAFFVFHLPNLSLTQNFVFSQPFSLWCHPPPPPINNDRNVNSQEMFKVGRLLGRPQTTPPPPTGCYGPACPISMFTQAIFELARRGTTRSTPTVGFVPPPEVMEISYLPNMKALHVASCNINDELTF